MSISVCVCVQHNKTIPKGIFVKLETTNDQIVVQSRVYIAAKLHGLLTNRILVFLFSVFWVDYPILLLNILGRVSNF